jgi:hypothetical protein
VTDHVPGFEPIYVRYSPNGEKFARYRCCARQETLTGEVRQCRWAGKKDDCRHHGREHDFTLPRSQDPTFVIPTSELLGYDQFNQRIRKLTAEFVSATNLSCRQAASPAMHKFILALLQLGASTPRDQYNHVVDMSTRFCEFNDKNLAHHIQMQSIESYRKALSNLQNYHFVNLIVDAGTVLKIKTIPCLLTNPFCDDPPVLLDLKENTNFGTEQYGDMFQELIVKVETEGLILSSVVIDNLRAQSSGLDMILAGNDAPIIHVKCFAHLANLVLSDTKKARQGNFNRVFDKLTEIQNELRTIEFKLCAGKRCPKFVETRWFYMVDVLAFILQYRVKIREFLSSRNNQSSLSDIPQEVFELHAILCPFSCFVNAVEARKCSIAYIIPLVRGLFSALGDVREILRTDTARTILRDMTIRLLARLSLNNVDEAIAAYTLTPAGRAELRELERGFRTRNAQSEIAIPKYEAHLDLKTHIKKDLKNTAKNSSKNDEYDYDGTFTALKEQIRDSSPIFEDHVPSDFWKRPGKEGDDIDDGRAESYRRHTAQYAKIPDEGLFTQDLYSPLYEQATKFIIQFARKTQMEENPSDLFDSWLFDDPMTIEWLANPRKITCINEMWRGAHIWRAWKQFSELALRLITTTTSESDAERLLSLEKDVIGHHGARFTCDGLRDRIWGVLAKRLAEAEARKTRVRDPPDSQEDIIEE